MSEFFHRWRRKAGCVTLLTALALMGSWVVEAIDLDPPTHVASEALDMAEADLEGEHATHEFQNNNRLVVKDLLLREFVEVPKCRLVMTAPVLAVPFWPLAIPLTALSAYLLLGKPGVAKSSAIR